MNIAVINIKDLIKYAFAVGIFVIIIISGTIIVKGKEELKSAETTVKENSSFLYCLEMQMPLMKEEEKREEKQKDKKTENNSHKILDTQLAMLYNMEDDHSIEDARNEEIIRNNQEEGEIQEENQDRKIELAENIETKVIDENNIAVSFTDDKNNIKVKNQSKYDIKDILENPNYDIKNKEKIIIYHTHTCESYTTSEKYNYEMTGAYRTTDLNFSVAKVRR